MLTFQADEFFTALKEFIELEHRVVLVFEEKGAKGMLSESESSRARFVINALFSECQRAALNCPLERQERLEDLGIRGRNQTKSTLETIK